jgi:hypothetical protein
MSAEYKNADLNKIAQDAERDLNTDAAKKGHGSNAGTLTHPSSNFSNPLHTNSPQVPTQPASTSP